MTEEKKEVVEETTTESKKEEKTLPPAQEEKTTGEEVVEDDSKKTTPDSDTDYKVLYEEEAEKLKKAEKAIVKHKKDNKEDIEESDVDTVKDIVKDGINEIRQDMVGDTIDGLAEQLCPNEDERKLVMFHYKNSIVQSGSSKKDILQDLSRAKLLANEKQIIAENKELKLSLVAKQTTSTAGVGSNQAKPKVEEKVELNAQEKVIMETTNQRRIARKEKPLTEAQFINNQLE